MDPTPPTPWWPVRPRASLPPFASLAIASLAIASLAMSGCADAEGTIEETDAVTGTSAGGMPAGYPEGPYGADVGEIMPDLRWRGFVDDDGAGLATDGPYVDVSLDQVRQGDARWALVHFGTVF